MLLILLQKSPLSIVLPILNSNKIGAFVAKLTKGRVYIGYLSLIFVHYVIYGCRLLTVYILVTG